MEFYVKGFYKELLLLILNTFPHVSKYGDDKLCGKIADAIKKDFTLVIQCGIKTQSSKAIICVKLDGSKDSYQKAISFTLGSIFARFQ